MQVMLPEKGKYRYMKLANSSMVPCVMDTVVPLEDPKIPAKTGPVSLKESYFPVALVTTLVQSPIPSFNLSFSYGDLRMACSMFLTR